MDNKFSFDKKKYEELNEKIEKLLELIYLYESDIDLKNLREKEIIKKIASISHLAKILSKNLENDVKPIIQDVIVFLKDPTQKKKLLSDLYRLKENLWEL